MSHVTGKAGAWHSPLRVLARDDRHRIPLEEHGPDSNLVPAGGNLLAARRGAIYLVATPRNPRGVMLDARS
jgi:hypothetical protein